MGQSQNETQFLTHPAGHVSHFHAEIEVEAFSELAAGSRQVASAHRPEDRERIGAVHPWRQPQVAGKVARVALDRLAVAPAIESKNRGGATGGTKETKHDTDGRRLASTVGTEKSEQCPLGHRERNPL